MVQGLAIAYPESIENSELLYVWGVVVLVQLI
jgi:hypothetical protein